jgi:hypothetical protein
MSTVWRNERRRIESDLGSGAIDRAITGFTELWDYRTALTHIAQRIESLKTACSCLEISGAEECLKSVREQAEHLNPPPGCESAQRALVFAMKSYGAALQSLKQGAEAGRPIILSEARGYLDDGDVLLCRAIQLTRKA